MGFTHALISGAGSQVSKALWAAMPGREILFTSSSNKTGAIPCDLAQLASIRQAFAEVKKRWPNVKCT